MTTIWINSVIMTLYLWHMTAFLLAIVVLWPLGIGTQTAGVTPFRYHPDLSWWLQRPLMLGVSSAILFGLILIFGRFERVKPR
jgi:hypothetical protein